MFACPLKMSGNKFEHRTVLSLAAWFLLLIVLGPLGCDREPPGSARAPTKAAANIAVSPVRAELVPLTNMVLIKAGTFRRLKFFVTITHDFWLDKYEVTQAEYTALMGKNPSHFKNNPYAPVEKVSFFDAMAYCAALTQRERQAVRLPPGYEYRLPSEAQWEYACRAGTTNQFSFGDAPADVGQYAWTWENSEGFTHPIGLKRPNPWGLYDMHGNVWEWCLDWFAPYPAKDLTDPSGPAEGKFKVFRGGGWEKDALYARAANRFMMVPANGIYFVGFRVALVQTSTERFQP
jgi:hypothetical protein